MSTEARLKRLGLWHLHDKPEELSKELSKRVAQSEKERAVSSQFQKKEQPKKEQGSAH